MAGQIFVISAPSGAGKTTLCRRLMEALPDLVYSVSFTTRPPRPGEEDGRDYHFISMETFNEMIENEQFLEWADVFGKRYGTGREWVEDHLEDGLDVVVDIDVDGARQIKRNHPEAVFIFILPPSIGELERRLKGRLTESDDQLELRLGRVREEIEARDIYDYLVINDDVDLAVDDLMSVILAERCRMPQSEAFWDEFFSKDEG